MRPDTRLVRFDACPDDPYRPVATPIYQTATFEQPSPAESGRYDYTRSGNPTRTVLEEQLARLEGASRALAYASGMAAIAGLTRLLRAGEEILAGDDLYGGTFRLLSKIAPRQGIAVRWVDATDPEAVAEAIGPATRLVLVETPTNPLFRIVDLERLARVVHARGVLLAVDSSIQSPVLQRPLELGADLVVHSGTKFLGGHGDVTAGVVAARDAALAEELAFHRNAEGNALAPFEAWLLLRGIKTLGVRLARQQANAVEVARFLAAHPLVRRVHYPGLPDHPGYEVHRRQSSGPGSVLSFETGLETASLALAGALRHFTVSVSFGCVSSSASLPCRMSHASIPPEVRRARSLPEDLVRLSIGLEDPADLIEDLERALEVAACGLAPAAAP